MERHPGKSARFPNTVDGTLPAKIKADKTPRPQFTHVVDVVPTIYEAIGITPPESVDGFKQDKLDGTSFAYTFNDPKAKPRKDTQYFEIFGNRAIYHDGWLARLAAMVGRLTPRTSTNSRRVDCAITTFTPRRSARRRVPHC